MCKVNLPFLHTTLPSGFCQEQHFMTTQRLQTWNRTWLLCFPQPFFFLSFFKWFFWSLGVDPGPPKLFPIDPLSLPLCPSPFFVSATNLQKHLVLETHTPLDWDTSRPSSLFPVLDSCPLDSLLVLLQLAWRNPSSYSTAYPRDSPSWCRPRVPISVFPPRASPSLCVMCQLADTFSIRNPTATTLA